MMDRVTIKERAKELMRQHLGPCICVAALYWALTAVFSGATFGLAIFFLSPALVVGQAAFALGVWRGEQPGIPRFFHGFTNYLQSLVSILWMELFIFLWSLLLVIPGIVKAMAYSMTPYLVADFPDLDPRRALKVSMAITEGHKAEIFVMYLSFFGWMILSGLTLSILSIVYVEPYMQTSLAGQYEVMFQDALNRGAITEADLRG